MARRRSKRSRASYVRAGKKAARTRARKRRRNPTRHRPVVYGTGRGKRRKLRRSPWYRLKPKRINRRRRRRTTRRYRRNPQRFQLRRYFGKARMMNAIALLAGLGGAGALKAFAAKMIPAENAVMQDWFSRLYGVGAIILGATINMQGRRKETKAVGTGMVVFGLYDAIVSNIPDLGQYLPVIGQPAFVSGVDAYGRDVLGAGITTGDVDVVGGNISTDMEPEIVGMDDMSLEDALEMSV